LLLAVAATLVLGIAPGSVLHAAQMGASTLQAPLATPGDIPAIVPEPQSAH
jgi:hypothetical protein